MSSHKKSSGKGGSESAAALQQSNMHEPEWTENAKHLQIWDMRYGKDCRPTHFLPSRFLNLYNLKLKSILIISIQGFFVVANTFVALLGPAEVTRLAHTFQKSCDQEGEISRSWWRYSPTSHVASRRWNDDSQTTKNIEGSECCKKQIYQIGNITY